MFYEKVMPLYLGLFVVSTYMVTGDGHNLYFVQYNFTILYVW